MAVDRKYERDIDLFLAKKFSVNPDFAVSEMSQQGLKLIGIAVDVADDVVVHVGLILTILPSVAFPLCQGFGL